MPPDSTQTADADDLRLAARAVEWAHDDGWCAKPCDCIEHMASLEALADIRPTEQAVLDAALALVDSEVNWLTYRKLVEAAGAYREARDERH